MSDLTRDPIRAPRDDAERASATVDIQTLHASKAMFGEQPARGPEFIGPYRVIRNIGEGGMGSVYLGVRSDDQFKKYVAIKIIKRGMDSESILSRFEQERQVLAALNHPNIARLLDGGATDDGRVYIVMEYVEGQPIHLYCDRNRLHVEERLRLFADLCHAVHHAHQNLIVHRDIKPGNVVVNKDGVVKLLDFGIAKLLNPQLSTFASEPTETQFRLMTPEYASPEQVRRDPISTASDIYSLGVLLYELLAGRRPYRFKTRLESEIERVICNEDPERPSTAATRAVTRTYSGEPGHGGAPTSLDAATDEQTTAEIAKLRELKPERLQRRLRGDLDNIVMLAMRKEPKRRYASAEQLAEDIKRHLDGMPVIARPATWNYRMTKFVRRNKAGVAAAAAIVVLLVAGVVVSTTFASIAQRQKTIAIKSKEQAQELRTIATNHLYGLTEEFETLPISPKTRQAVVEAELKYLEDFKRVAGDTPSLRLELAEGYLRIGEAYGGLSSNSAGRTSDALANFTAALSLFQQVAREEPDNIAAQRGIVNADIKIGELHRRDNVLAKSLERLQEADAIAQSLLQKHPSDPETMRWSHKAQSALADTLRKGGQIEEAKARYTSALATARQLADMIPAPPDAKREYTVVLGRIGFNHQQDKQFDDAIAAFTECLQIRKQLLQSDPDNVRLLRDVGVAHLQLGEVHRANHQAERASPHYQEYQTIAKRLRDDSITLRYTIDLATATHGLAACAHDADNDELALALCNEARVLIEQLLKIDAGNRAVLTLSALVNDLSRRVNSESAERSE